MPESQTTPIMGLPMLVAGQAQKEITHNEALVMIDALVAGMAVAGGVNTPAAQPQPGQCWLVGDSPTGPWSGRAGALAIWTVGGWRFAQLPVHSVIRVGAAAVQYRRTPTGWAPPATILDPAGGTVIDSECRIAVNQLIAAAKIAGITSDS